MYLMTTACSTYFISWLLPLLLTLQTRWIFFLRSWMCQILFCFIAFKQVVLSAWNSLSLKLILFPSRQPSVVALNTFFFRESHLWSCNHPYFHEFSCIILNVMFLNIYFCDYSCKFCLLHWILNFKRAIWT